MSHVLEARIVELESKVAFQEDTINRLNEALQAQQEQLLKMQRQVKLLAERQTNAHTPAVAALSEETPPPHY
ncbi:SlyX family protein [Algicola sagamiensis]|uniref:SlyX family protein n=1 Tax=Algicola sagamiensis TaxID=163869 RepID=UPI00037472B0|nr:SlyX family protein [Algicola sagamiensis]